MDKYTLRRQVVFVTSLIIIAIVFFYTMLTRSNLENYHINNLKSKMNSQAVLMADILRDTNDDVTTAILQEKVRYLSSVADARVTLVDSNGLVIGDSKVKNLIKLDNHLNREEITEATHYGTGEALRYSNTLKTDMLYYALKVDEMNSEIAFIRLAIPLSEIDKLLRDQMISLIFLTAIGVIILIFLNSILIKRLVNPLESVNHAFSMLARGKTGLLLNIKPSNVETKQLIKAFNNMSLQIKENITRIENREMELTTLITSMVNGLLFINEKGYTKIINPAARKLLSYTGTINAEYVTVIRNTKLINIVEQALSEREYSQSEIKLNIKTVTHIVQLITVPLYADVDNTDFRGIMLLMHDISAIRHIEQTRKDLIANVSHELRTPITSIAGFIETILDMDEDDENVKDFLKIIYKETERLTKLIEDLLELANMEAGQVTISLGEVSINQAIDEVLKRYTAKAQKKNIVVDNRVKNSLSIKADLFRVEQILDNVISNAIKYTPEKGIITISSVYDREYLTVKVTDTGYGIDSTKLHRITEQFYRTDRGRTRGSAGGYGLGLAIVKSLIEAQNGELIINSELGHGTEVLLKFPLFS